MASRTQTQHRPRVLADFEGTWDILRDVIPVTGPRARFEGQGIWTRAAGGCTYLEVGKLHMPNVAPMHAERRYFWSDGMAVFFDDGRFFHDVPPDGGRTQHDCAPDTYVVEYDFGDWPAFHVRWSVTGPRKDYVSDTWYKRSA